MNASRQNKRPRPRRLPRGRSDARLHAIWKPAARPVIIAPAMGVHLPKPKTNPGEMAERLKALPC